MIDKLKDDNKSLCKDLLKANKDRRASRERAVVQGSAEGEIKVLKDKINKEVLV